MSALQALLSSLNADSGDGDIISAIRSVQGMPEPDSGIVARRADGGADAAVDPAGYFCRFTVAGLLRGSHKDRAEFYRTLYGIGALAPNEIRAYEDLSL